MKIAIDVVSNKETIGQVPCKHCCSKFTAHGLENASGTKKAAQWRLSFESIGINRYASAALITR